MLLLLALARGVCGQAPYSLHVNVRLLQVPALVLGPELQPLQPIDAKRFDIRLDEGPRFHPLSARLEGDDPISLAILLDMDGSESDVLKEFEREFPGWLAASFRPFDRIAIYGLDCEMRSNSFLPGNSPILPAVLSSTVHATDVHGGKTKSACGSSVLLWNAITIVEHQMKEEPGRRVILALTGGYDGGSRAKVRDVEDIAIDRSISVFALSQQLPFFDREVMEQTLSPLCRVTGGLLTISTGRLQQELQNVIAMLRGRYILEFQEPSNATAGRHRIEVTVQHAEAVVLPAGVTAPLAKRGPADDPTLIPTDTSKAPRLGDHPPHDR
jgi:hypothetical protein